MSITQQAIDAAAKAIHAQICDPHANHERDSDGTGFGWICLDCTAAGGDEDYVAWFRREPDDEMDLAVARAALEAAAPLTDFGAGYEAGRNLYRSGAYINGKRDALLELAVWCEQKAAAVGEPDATTLKVVAAHARERAQ